MTAGTQIMSAITFVTSEDPVNRSFAFVMGVLLATAIGVAALTGVLSLVDDKNLGHSSDNGSAEQIIQYALVALLVATATPRRRARRAQAGLRMALPQRSGLGVPVRFRAR
jgi:hypothetical protein